MREDFVKNIEIGAYQILNREIRQLLTNLVFNITKHFGHRFINVTNIAFIIGYNHASTDVIQRNLDT